MNNKNLLSLATCFFNILILFSQTGQANFRPPLVENIDFATSGNLDITSEAYFSSLNNTIAISDVDGSPYFNKNFLPVKINTFENVSYLGRFNAYNGLMEIITAPGKSPIALNLNTSSYTVEFIENKKVYQTYNFNDLNGLSGVSFFVNININKASLLKKEFVKFIDKKVAVDYYKKDQPAKFVRQNDTYYFVTTEGIAKEISSNKKQVASMFPNHYDTIIEYINSNKVKLSKEADLIKLSNFISSIL